MACGIIAGGETKAYYGMAPCPLLEMLAFAEPPAEAGECSNERRYAPAEGDAPLDFTETVWVTLRGQDGKYTRVRLTRQFIEDRLAEAERLLALGLI